MVLGYSFDPEVVRRWNDNCALYRKRTRWLWFVLPVATLIPAALLILLGDAASIVSLSLFVIGMLVIGIVLGRETHLLFCPHCGRRPTPRHGRYQSPLYSSFCVRCGFWLRNPS
jgi:hypothetical protein